ncbi:MAG: beta-eliminating lyase-related protein [Hyphomicrobiales bacterium]|nr:beta-eliminating lyase-related protein [Hyphomicrobiales bacterium]
MIFSSDNWAGACEPVLAALLDAGRAGPAPAYGADEVTKRLERRFSDLFERDVAVLLVATGTAANALSLAALAPPWGAVVAHEEAHVAADECGAPEFFTGARLLRWPARRGKFAPEDLARRLADAPRGLHQGELSALSISSPNEYGLVWTSQETRAIAEVAKAHGLALHLDGARFANALARLGCTPAEATWKAGVDVMSFGGTKGGCLMAEAIVAFDPSLRDKLAYLRKRGAQLVSKHRLISAQFEAWLADGLWLRLAAHANAMAEDLAWALTAAPDVRLAWEPEANEVFAFMSEATAARLRAGGAHFYDWSTAALAGEDAPRDGEKLWRFVTSFATRPEDVAGIAALV